jgi:prepilin-type N-terminal cleavage/methylation domain-containing protein
MKMKKGFTLIELLVVIAIIGLLSAVVFASLNSARGKGADAAIKANLANIFNQGELIYDSAGCYSDNVVSPTACSSTTFLSKSSCPVVADSQNAGLIFNNPAVLGMIAAAKSAYGTGWVSTCVESANQASWAAAVVLKTRDAGGKSQVWCVDSLGAAKMTSGVGGANIAPTQANVDATVTTHNTTTNPASCA